MSTPDRLTINGRTYLADGVPASDVDDAYALASRQSGALLDAGVVHFYGTTWRFVAMDDEPTSPRVVLNSPYRPKAKGAEDLGARMVHEMFVALHGREPQHTYVAVIQDATGLQVEVDSRPWAHPVSNEGVQRDQ